MKLSVRTRRYLLGTVLLLSLLGALFAIRPLRELRIRVNDLDFLPADSPVLAADQAIRERFGSDERLILAFEGLRRDLEDPESAPIWTFF